MVRVGSRGAVAPPARLAIARPRSRGSGLSKRKTTAAAATKSPVDAPYGPDNSSRPSPAAMRLIGPAIRGSNDRAEGAAHHDGGDRACPLACLVHLSSHEP